MEFLASFLKKEVVEVYLVTETVFALHWGGGMLGTK